MSPRNDVPRCYCEKHAILRHSLDPSNSDRGRWICKYYVSNEYTDSYFIIFISCLTVDALIVICFYVYDEDQCSFEEWFDEPYQ